MSNTITEKVRAIVQLSRWRQHVPFTVPLVLVGALMATNQSEAVIDWRLLPVILANVLAMVFAFMINDVIDAPDDALDPVKTKSNVISQGLLTVREAGIVCAMVFLLSAVLFGFSGLAPLVVGLCTLILSLFYSAPVIRLKARPVVDVISHVLMLSALLPVSSYVIYDTAISTGWWVIAGVAFASAYGQFYNQLADFETDQAAGLNNTAILIGRTNTVRVMVISALLTVMCFVVAIIFRVFPLWLGWVAATTTLTMSFFQWDVDMRGNATDASGMVQRPVLITANIVAFMWLLHNSGLIGTG